MPISVGVLAGEPGLGGSGDYIRVITPSGSVLNGPLGSRAVGDATLVSMNLNSPTRGWYLVHWNVLASDGHPMGGEEGAWWTFGVKATTATVKRATTVRFEPVVPGTPPFTGTVNGTRIGLRKLTLSRIPGIVNTAKVALKGAVDGSANPEFPWDVTTNQSQKSTTISGIFPRAGTYVVDVVLTIQVKNIFTRVEYAATVTISA